MPGRYDSSSIEVLKGLEPVRKRPGMYTQTERPNHLAQEVVDNSVDEAITGYARQIDIILHKDGSLTVVDDGRGMPVDRHKGEKVSGVEVILTRLHAGAKFSSKNYKFSGGLQPSAQLWRFACVNFDIKFHERKFREISVKIIFSES